MQIYLDRNIDLDQPIVPEIIKDTFFSTEQYAHVLRLKLNRSGTAVAWTGLIVTACAVREDGITVLLAGTVSGDTCSITLPYDCYLCPGRLTVTVNTEDTNEQLLTILCMHIIVVKATTDTQTDPNNSFPSLPALDARVTALEQGQTTGSVTGVKGDAESTYRTGQVNLTAANVGAVTSSDVSTIVSQAVAAAMLAAYPVGSIYISTSSTNPGTFLGGTWTRIQDTFLLAAGSTYSAGATGGEATHTLTEAEMPYHRHSYSTAPQSWGERDTSANQVISPSSGSAKFVTKNTNYAGGYNGTTQAHNNMPPYLAVYAWERTA